MNVMKRCDKLGGKLRANFDRKIENYNEGFSQIFNLETKGN